MSPHCSRTLRCLETPGRVMSNGAASSLTVASPVARRARMARLVGSARAANVASSRSSTTVMSGRQERGEDGGEHGRVDAVVLAVQGAEFGVRDSLAQGGGGLGHEDRAGGSVHDQSRDVDLRGSLDGNRLVRAYDARVIVGQRRGDGL